MECSRTGTSQLLDGVCVHTNQSFTCVRSCRRHRKRGAFFLLNQLIAVEAENGFGMGHMLFDIWCDIVLCPTVVRIGINLFPIIAGPEFQSALKLFHDSGNTASTRGGVLSWTCLLAIQFVFDHAF